MSTGYQTIIGGSAIYPSNQTYSQITLNADTQLSWPIEAVSSEIVVSDLIDVTPISQNGWDLILPDATGGSNGITMIVNNLSGTFSFNVNDFTGNIILAVPTGTVWLIYLNDNSTSAGVWRTFQYGASAGSVNVAAIAGSGILAIGTSLNQSMPVQNKSTNYTAVSADRATVILWTGGAGTLTLPAPSGVANNWFINVRNAGTGDLTVSGAPGNIDGAGSKTFTSGVGSAIIFTDGTNYWTIGYGTSGSTTGFDYTTINAAGSDGVNGQIVLSGGQLNRVSYKVFGALTGTRTIVVPTSIQQYWINNQTTSTGGPWTLTVKTAAGGGQTVSQPGQAILYCDGTDVQPAVSGISLPVAISSGGTGATTAAAARTNLGSTAVGDAVFTAVTANAARTQLGSGTVGDAIFISVTASSALTAMAGGTMTGNFTLTGNFQAATETITGIATVGTLSVTTSTQPGANLVGLYKPAANQLGFSTNNLTCGNFDASQILNLAHALPIASGGTNGTTQAAARTGIGLTTMDSASSASTIVQRTAANDVFGRAFNMSLAVDNATAAVNVPFDSGDGYLRRTSLAHFSSQVTPDALSTATGTPPSYSARAFVRFANNASGTVAKAANCTVTRVSTGLYTITFTTAMPDANYAVTTCTQQIAANQYMMTMLAQGTTPSTASFQVEVTNSASRVENGGIVYLAVFD